jgi:chromosome segregation ATPase
MEVIERVHRDLAEHSAHLKNAMAAIDTKSSEFAELMQQHGSLQTQHEGLQRQHEDLQRQHENLSAQYSQLEKVSEVQRLEQAKLENTVAELRLTKLQLEQHLRGMQAVTRSRRWLLRRIAHITIRGSATSDVDLG